MKFGNKKKTALILSVILVASIISYQIGLASVPSEGTYYLDIPFGTASYYIDAFDNGTITMVNGSTWQLVETSTDVVELINWAWGNISDSGIVFLKAGQYSGSGMIEKPANKSVGLIGEIYDQESPTAVTVTCQGIDATEGVETFLILENIVFVCNEDVDAFINCTTTIPRLKNLRIMCENKSRIGFVVQPTSNGKCAVVDCVDVYKPKAYAAYISSDWFNCPTWISTYQAIQNASDNDCLFWIAGGYGITINKLHLYTPANNPDYGLRTSAETVIGFLDLEGVTCDTALIYQGGALTLDYIRIGSAPDMLASDWHAQFTAINSYQGRRLEDMIDLINPAAWTSGSHSSDLSTYVYIPNATTLTSGNTVYYLYNKWMQFYNWGSSPIGLSSTKVSITPVTTLPVGLYVSAFDNDYGANHRLAIVVQNHSGANVTLTEDLILWLKIC